MPVRTFKAIDNELKFFGFWLPDVLLFFFSAFLPSAVLRNVALTVVSVGVVATAIVMLRNRPARYLRDSLRFVYLPGQYVVGYAEERFR